MPVTARLSLKELNAIQELYEDCKIEEDNDTFFPHYRNCGVCAGYIYASTFLVNGCCACVMAHELEMMSATAKGRPAVNKHPLAALGGSASSNLIAKILALSESRVGPSTPRSTYYLRANRRVGRELPLPHRKSTRDVRRHRMPKGRAHT